MKGIYAAVFEPKDGRVYVRVPDLPGCVTSGGTMEEAYEMALDAANLWLTVCSEEEGFTVPKATPLEKIECPASARVMLIRIDTDEYIKQLDKQAVRRTVSIPRWMDQAAQKQGVSLSKVLQEALRNQFA